MATCLVIFISIIIYTRYIFECSEDEKFSTCLMAILRRAVGLDDLFSDEDETSKCMYYNAEEITVSKMQSHLITDRFKPFVTVRLLVCKVMVCLLGEAKFTDFTIKVEDQTFLVHKDILCAYSEYFSAMLQTSSKWSETKQDCIVLNDITAKAFSIYVCYMYGAFVEFPFTEMTEILDLMKVVDMFGAEDIIEAICVSLEQDICHSFHKPCPECVSGISLTMQICEQYNLSHLYKKCIKWHSKYFRSLWPMKDFSKLSSKIQKHSYSAVVESLNVGSVVKLTLATDKLIGHLASVGCAMSAVRMSDDLMNECQNFIVGHFLQLTEKQRIKPLFQAMWYKRNVTEEILDKVVSQLDEDNACFQCVALEKLLLLAKDEQWSQDVTMCLTDAFSRVSHYLTTSYYVVIHTDSWNLLSRSFKEELKSRTMCQGDPMRKPRPKPVLTSSKKKRSLPGKPVLKVTKPRRVGAEVIQTKLSNKRKQRECSPGIGIMTTKKDSSPCLQAVTKNPQDAAKEPSSAVKDSLPTEVPTLGRLEYSEECKLSMLPPIIVKEVIYQALTSSTDLSDSYVHLQHPDPMKE